MSLPLSFPVSSCGHIILFFAFFFWGKFREKTQIVGAFLCVCLYFSFDCPSLFLYLFIGPCVCLSACFSIPVLVWQEQRHCSLSWCLLPALWSQCPCSVVQDKDEREVWACDLAPLMPSFCPQEEPATPRELGLGLGLGLKEKEEAVVVVFSKDGCKRFLPPPYNMMSILLSLSHQELGTVLSPSEWVGLWHWKKWCYLTSVAKS